ncbi:flagellar hook-associated protein FlgK [Halomonas sp. DN3]|uniref:flagellar hook-associated protein FlgK n=1 Tax=Halomonas sp. DN3 TaxID=2953657 RepID=UPI00209CA1B9|nr:flagellar hook-associated protein FlgK [Halomonas sp. DN3]USZ49738.1 flagellar hook-associated protein FlgK [Halomonas sp. DN3]
MSMFSIGLSGLNAAQNALTTTSNNISNVYTPGYNREITVLGEGSGGTQGVQVNDIERQFNQYVADQLNGAVSSSSALNAYQTQVNQIDSLLADQDAGLAPLMQNFFSSLEDLASAPSDPAARQGVLGAADTLSAQFRAFDSYLQDMQDGINSQIRDEITQINNQSEELASLNREISLAKAKTGEAPNALLNQRDQLVTEMSERIGVELTVQDGSSYRVSLPGGQPLVAGTDSYQLKAVSSPNDPQRLVVGYQDPGGGLQLLDEDSLQGGSLGGLIQFRSETLDRTQNQIGQLAVSMAVAFNAQHAEGIDLDGNPGGAMFDIGEPRVFANDANDGGATVTASFDTDNISELEAADYEVKVKIDESTGAQTFEVTRKDTGEAVDASFDATESELSFGGVTLAIDDTSALADGDRFEVQPVRRAAGGFDNAISDPDKIAAAGESGASGDNENALALQGLQDKMSVGGSATLSQAYASLVSDVGNRTNVVQVNLAAQQGLTEQLSAVKLSESGVNLDEEAANLIRYQQYYQANAKVIDTATSVVDTILGLRG